MCDTMAIIEPGRVLFAKNSDRDPNEAQCLEWRPRQTHKLGETVQCTWIAIPQAAETYATLLSRPFWMWGAEIGANEHGVVIGNEAVFTNQPYAESGLTGMDLLRLALERSDTAARACEIIAELLDDYGQGGGCGHENRRFTYHNSFLVVDATSGFIIETAGRELAVEPFQGARSISNGLTLPRFAEEYSDVVKTHVSGCRARRTRTAALLRGCSGAGDLFRILRDHGEGHPYPQYSWVNGGLNAPCVHASGRIAASQTTASWVAELRPDGVRHWVTATSAPCTSLFKPVHVNQPLDLGPAPCDRADASLWWRHERFHRAVVRDALSLYPRFTEERDAIERTWLDTPPDSREAFEEHDRLLAQWSEEGTGQAARDIRPGWVRRYWGRRNRRAGL